MRPDNADEQTWEAQIGRIERLATRWTGNDTRTLVLPEQHILDHPDDPVLTSIRQEGRTVAGNPTWLRAQLRKAPR